MSAATVREHLAECLDEVDFPASRDDLIDAATRRGDPTSVQALRAIPPAEYTSLDEVFAEVRFDDEHGGPR